MPEFDRYTFEAYEVGQKKERFMGNAFVVQVDGKRRLVTAEHVVFNKGVRRKLLFRSHDGQETIKGAKFVKHGGWEDISHAEVDGEGGFDILDDPGVTLFIHAAMFHGYFKDHVLLKVKSIGENVLHYKGANDMQFSSPGSSGAPIIDEEGRVVAVHCAGGWENGWKNGYGFRLRKSLIT